MRILYVSESFWPRIGGMEIYGLELLVPLAAAGHEVTVLTSRDGAHLPAAERHADLDIRRLELVEAVSRPDPEVLLRVRREVSALAEEVRPEILHVAYPGVGAYFGLRVHASLGVPMVVRLHGAAEPRGRTTLLRRLLAEAAWITVNSEATLEAALALEPGIAGRSTVAVGAPVAPDVPAVPVPSGPPVVAAAARLVPEKGFDVLLEAFAEVLAARPEARLVLAGDGPERPRLETLARSLGVARATTFQGWLGADALRALLDAATVVAVPSTYEPFGRIAVEAGLRARPVVASRTGGLPEAAGGERTALLVEPGEPRDLAAAILDCLSDLKRSQRMGEAARRRALDLVAATSAARTHETVYRRLAG